MRDENSIDLVICTYNNARLLKKTLDHIAQQRTPPGLDWRVLVVNNNCTDQTADVVDEYLRSRAMPLSTVVEPTQGLTPARVCGVRNTTGAWVAFIDDDCMLADDWVEQAVRFADDHPRCGAFGGQVTPDWEAVPPPHVTAYRYGYAKQSHGETAHRRGWVVGAGMVVRRSALEACGWVEHQFLQDRVGQRLVSGGDVEIVLRVASEAEVWYNPACRIRHIIPARRTERPYVRRLFYGLGASRHNAQALTWRGSYAAWVPYSAAYSFGLLGLGLRKAAGELARGRLVPDLRTALSGPCGWWSAMWGMFRMDPAERRRMLGCAVPRVKAETDFGVPPVPVAGGPAA
jgi:glycosyltransferase involved in cell wall biosynthesis